MLRIAVVDDEEICVRQLQGYITQFGKQHQIDFEISEYNSGSALVEHYKPGWDIILLDIQMAGLDGMETARRIRTLDEDVVLIFITNMAQYALCGYEVNAYDFVLKPITYPAFSMKMQKITKRLAKTKEKFAILSVPGGFKREPVSDICYIEIQNHRLLCHTVNGIYPLISGTLTALEEQLQSAGFYRCNNCYLVNMRYVTGFASDSVKVGEDELVVSRSRKKGFMEALTQYVGGM